MTLRSFSCRRRAAWPILAAFAAAATLLPGAQAAAADYATRDVGQWTVSASSDRQGCFLTRTYPAPRATTLLFGLDTDGSNRLTILNANWSIREKEQLKLTFRLSKASFPRHAAIGIAAEGKKGFVTSFGPTFPNSLAASTFLRVQRGDVPVEDLGLEGSGAAIAELRTCVDRYRTAGAPARSDRQKGDRIPLDPFAVKAKRESKQ